MAKNIPTLLPIVLPVGGGFISSGFGTRPSPFNSKKHAFHEGLDIVVPLGTPIYAPADGVVTCVGRIVGLGNYIILTHAGSVTTRYGHIKEAFVKEGQEVKKGDKIAAVGMTGRTTGAHLHYEIRIKNKLVNPKKFLMSLPASPHPLASIQQ